jgi:hypothetical protein
LIDKPESLCARLLQAKYFPNGNLLDTVFTGNSSAVWKGIEYGLELLKKGVIWRVGNGRKIRAWRDPWIPKGPTFRPITVKGECRYNRVSDFLDIHGAWNTTRLNEYFRTMDVEAILKIRTSPRAQEDFVAWQPEKSGNFTVRSAYHLAISNHVENTAGGATSSRPDGKRPIWNLIWKSPMPQKMKIFAWKVVTGALATRGNMKWRHLETIGTCRLCGITDEDSFHALITCPSATKVWDCMRDVWSLPRNEEIKNSGQEWLFDLLSSVSEEVRNMIIMLTWRIWQLRNDLIHDKGIPPTEVTKRYLTSYFGSLVQIRQQSVTEIVKGKRPCVTSVQPSVAPPRSMSPPWPKPIPGWNALSVDGSFDEEGRAGTGMVLRDSNGSVIFSAHRCLQHCNDAMEAEVSAVMEGLALAHM